MPLREVYSINSSLSCVFKSRRTTLKYRLDPNPSSGRDIYTASPNPSTRQMILPRTHFTPNKSSSAYREASAIATSALPFNPIRSPSCREDLGLKWISSCEASVRQDLPIHAHQQPLYPFAEFPPAVSCRWDVCEVSGSSWCLGTAEAYSHAFRHASRRLGRS